MDTGNTKGKTKYGLDRFDLKMIAAAAMTVDHLAHFFLRFEDAPALYVLMRCFGRLTAPIMCFFIAEGFVHTSSRLRYGIRLALFAVISQIPYSYLNAGRFSLHEMSMITTLLLSFFALCAWEYIKPLYIRLPVILALLYLCSFCDWYFFAPVWVLTFYILHGSRMKQIAGYAITSCVMMGGWALYYVIRFNSWLNLVQLAVLLAVPLLLLYNGRRGPGGKIVNYFFYIYYPLHLLIIYLVKMYLI